MSRLCRNLKGRRRVKLTSSFSFSCLPLSLSLFFSLRAAKGEDGTIKKEGKIQCIYSSTLIASVPNGIVSYVN